MHRRHAFLSSAPTLSDNESILSDYMAFRPGIPPVAFSDAMPFDLHGGLQPAFPLNSSNNLMLLDNKWKVTIYIPLVISGQEA